MKMSIKYKILSGQIIIFLLGFLSLSFIINMVISSNNKSIITRDMDNLKRNMDVYIEQYSYIYNEFDKPEEFIDEADKLRNYLKDNIRKEVWFYSLNGNKINSDNYVINNYIITESDEMIESAVKGNTAFKIEHSQNETNVFFTYQVSIKGVELGIIGIQEDYSKLYNDSRKLMELIELSILGVFMLLFIFSLLTSNQIVKPIVKFSNFTKKIEAGKYEERLNYNSNDEIGELSNDLNNMSKKIKEQIEVIKKDRDALKELDEHRKVFLDNVTHELKTPLTIIMGYGQALLEDGIKNEEFSSKAAGHIYDESKRLNKMVVQLLELSFENKEELYEEFEKINFSEVVLSMCNSMRLKADRYSCEIINDVKPELYIMGIKDKLKQILVNILDNAIKYSKINGKIRVILEEDEENILLTIKDKGIGISKEQLENIFEPFYRGNKMKSRELGSNGLGLAIVKAIVIRHRGEIFIESEENIGTTVKITFPRCK